MLPRISRCAAVAILSALCLSALVTSLSAQVRIPDAAREQGEVQDTRLQAVLTDGDVLERERRWGEALNHYEDALRDYPNRMELQQRRDRSRVHYDLARRYADRSFVESLSSLSLEEALQKRRSVREFRRGSLSLDEVAQLLWAAQGITRQELLRTAPSAGALYPLELYLVAGQVKGLPAGLYRYSPERHDLQHVADGDSRRALAAAALDQAWVRQAPAVLVITGVYARSAVKYGQRAQRYTHIEVGNVAQNVYLQATALGLGTVFVGAFNAAKVQEVLELPADHEPLGLMPVGQD